MRVAQDDVRTLELEFYRKVNAVIANKITPIYNFCILVFAAFFAYFVVMEPNQCFARDQSAWGVQYSNTEDVTHQFYLLSVSGMVLLLIGALMYYLQGKEDMYDIMRPYVILINFATLGWFLSLQYFRFKDTGRACSGDFLGPKLPANYDTVYLPEWGQWILVFVVCQYILYVLCKIVAIIITNKLEAEFEEKKANI